MNIDLLDLRFAIDLTIIATVCIFSMFMAFRVRQWLLILFVPALILAGADSYTTVNSMSGFSGTDPIPTREVEVIAARSDKTWVHFWYVDRDTGRPRALKLPRNDTTKNAEQQIGLNLRSGQRSFVNFKGEEEDDKEQQHKGGTNGNSSKRVGGNHELEIYTSSREFLSIKDK